MNTCLFTKLENLLSLSRRCSFTLGGKDGFFELISLNCQNKLEFLGKCGYPDFTWHQKSLCSWENGVGVGLCCDKELRRPWLGLAARCCIRPWPRYSMAKLILYVLKSL